MSRKPRRLRPDEEELWGLVARSAKPLSAKPKTNLLTPTTKPKTPPAPSGRAFPAFHVGSKAQTASTTYDFAPSVSQRVADAPLRMNKRTFSQMKRGKAVPEARIDLHGMTAAAAHTALTGFLLRSFSDGKRLVLVITGKGRQSTDTGPIPTPTGILRHQLPDWISRPPLDQIVLQITHAHQRHGGSGAFYLYLARNR